MSSSEKIADAVDFAAGPLGSVAGSFGLVSWAVSAIVVAVKLAAFAIRLSGEDAAKHLANLEDVVRQRHEGTEARRLAAGLDEFDKGDAANDGS